MYVISSNGETIHLSLDSKHENYDNKPQTSLGNASAERYQISQKTPNLVTRMLLKLLEANSFVFMLL